MSRLSTIAPLLLVLWTGASGAVEAPTAGAASATTVTLPSGPGSVRGLADPATVSGFTGQVTYSVPLPLPSGPGGLAPSLSLDYSGALGNGPIGIGWTLGLPEIRRSTRHGVPRFTSEDELELSGLGGGGRLVRGPDLGYRVMGLGDQVRVWPEAGGFTATDGAGRTWRFRATHASGPRVAAWRISQIEDRAGHTIDFGWSTRLGEHYLDWIAWGPDATPPGGAPSRRYRVSLLYGSRPDVITSYRSGFEIRTGERLQRITVTVGGALLRSLALDYHDTAIVPVSRLAAVTLTGTDGVTAHPTTRFYYGTGFAPRAQRLVDQDQWRLGERGATLLDVDGDGLSDLVRFELGQRHWKRNRLTRFEDPRELPGGTPRPLEELRVVDLNGDLAPELVHKVAGTWRELALEAVPPPDDAEPGPARDFRLVERGPVPGTADLPLFRADTTLLDLNGDGRSDLLFSRGSAGLHVAFGRSLGYSHLISVPPVSDTEPEVEPGDPRFQIHDVNGDGLADVTFFGQRGLSVYLGRGDGSFAKRRRFDWPWGEADSVGLDALRLADLNRDGLLDLVRVEFAHVYLFAGHPTGFAKTPSSKLSRPKDAGPDDVVTIADLNGNGSSDLVWSTRTGLWALDLAGNATQAMLTRIENGLGGRFDYDYSASALMAQEAERAGNPWGSQSGTSFPVPWRVRVRTGRPGDPERITAYRVRDAFYDAEERQFGGFLHSTVTNQADPDRQSEQIVVETRFLAGLGLSRVLRGKAWHELRFDGTGRVIEESATGWDARHLTGMPLGEARLRVARAMWAERHVHEGASEPGIVRTEYAYDGAGHPVREVTLGRVDLEGDETVTERRFASNADTGVFGAVCAERISATVGGPALRYTRTLYDERAPTPGPCDVDAPELCPCTVTDGRPVATDAWLAPVALPAGLEGTGRWIRSSETDYDEHGNPIRSLQGGVERLFDYDASGHLPVAETILGAAEPLVFVAEWEPVLDAVTRVTDPSGLSHALRYDALGRVTAKDGPLPGGGSGVLESYRYVSQPVGVGAGPFVETTRHEHGAAPDGLTLAVLNGLGEPVYSATLTGTEGTTAGPWVVSGYRVRSRLGLTTELYDPFATALDPRTTPIAPPAPGSVPVERLRYDAKQRPIEHRLPSTPSLPSGVTVAMTYSPFGLRTDRTWVYEGPDGTRVAMSGAPETVETDGQDRTIRTTRTVTGSAEPNETTAVTYDATGAIVTEDLQNGRVVRRFITDSLGRLRRASDPDTGVRLWTWDDTGRLLASENGEGDRIEYDYDGAGRLATRRLLSATEEELSTFRYDAPLAGCSAGAGGGLGRLLGVTLDRVATSAPPERLETTCWSYGIDGRQSLTSRDLLGKTLYSSSTHSPSGLVLSSTVADSAAARLTLSQAFDVAGRLIRVDAFRPGLDENAALLWAATGFDESGGVRAEQFGSGAATAYERDALGLVTRIRVGDAVALAPVVGAGASPSAAQGLEAALWDLPPPAVRLDLGVRYDGIGAPIEVTDHVPSLGLDQSARYAYDPAGRLIGAAMGSGPAATTFTYTYDALQNLTARTATNATPGLVARLGTYLYGGTAHPRRLLNAAGLPLSYDDAGRTTGYGDWTQYFDADDRIRRIERPSEVPLTYAYGADGDRIAAWEGETLTERRYGPSLLHRPEDTELQLYLQVGDRPVARIDLPETLPTTTAALDVRYLHKGVSAGPVLVTGPDAALLEERVYEPYGALLATQGSGGDEPYGWLNKPVDPNTLWTDHGARWYSPEIARWLSSDPLSWTAPMAQLPFAYVSGRPTLMWDPDGQGEVLNFFVDALAGDGTILDDIATPSLPDRGRGVFVTRNDAGESASHAGDTVAFAKDTAQFIGDWVPGYSQAADAYNIATSCTSGDFAKCTGALASAVVPGDKIVKGGGKIIKGAIEAAPAVVKKGAEVVRSGAEAALNKVRGASASKGALSSGRKVTTHGAERMAERGFSDDVVESIIKNNRRGRQSRIDTEGRKTWEYTDKRGNTVVTNETGDVVTVFSPAEGGTYIPKPPR